MSSAFAAAVTPTHVWDSSRDEYVSADHMRLAQLIHQYDSRFSLEYVPANDRVNATPDEHAKPFRIVERTATHGRQVTRYLTPKDMDDPAGVLTWLWEADLAKHSPDSIYSRIQAREAAERMVKLAKMRDEAEERQDIMAFAVSGGRDRKHYLRLGKTKIAR